MESISVSIMVLQGAGEKVCSRDFVILGAAEISRFTITIMLNYDVRIR